MTEDTVSRNTTFRSTKDPGKVIACWFGSITK